jgi:hypothetical protein
MPLLSWRWTAGLPVPVPAETQPAQKFTGFPIAVAIQIALPLWQKQTDLTSNK